LRIPALDLSDVVPTAVKLAGFAPACRAREPSGSLSGRPSAWAPVSRRGPSCRPTRLSRSRWCRDPARGHAELLFRGCGAARASAAYLAHNPLPECGISLADSPTLRDQTPSPAWEQEEAKRSALRSSTSMHARLSDDSTMGGTAAAQGQFHLSAIVDVRTGRMSARHKAWRLDALGVPPKAPFIP
jgi:hypothetical protein